MCVHEHFETKFGTPPGTRTPTNSFGDCHAAITLGMYIWCRRVGTIHRPTPYQDGALPLSYGGKNLVEPDGIEPLAATPLNNGYRVTAGNGEQAPNL